MRIHSRLLAALKVLPVVVLAYALAACGGGGGGAVINPGGQRPSISSITPSQGAVGDRIVITGQNFGDVPANSTVTLGGVLFTINSWSDTQIDATIGAGSTSGIVVVTVDGLPSQSGTQAQFFIPTRPNGAPILNSLNPNFGRQGTDTVTLIGENFGTAAGGQVLFTAIGGGTVAANVSSQNVGGTQVDQWSATSVVVFVPATAASGPVTITTTEGISNGLQFTALPPPSGQFPPVITGVTSNDTNIGIGSVLHILGQNFGPQQNGSSVTISGLNMTVINWSTGQIDATVPVGATTSAVTVTVGGKFAVSDPVIVGNRPHITGVSPSQVRIGQSLDIFGVYFGAAQGTGTLTVGGKTITPTSWTDTKIHVDVVPPVTADSNRNMDVVVTADNTLASDPFQVSLSTNLKATMTVSPTAGVVGVTSFSFLLDVTGGSDDYSYSLISDKTNLSAAETETTNNPFTYTYKASQMGASAQKTFNTAVIVKDNQSGETLTFDGPSVLVVAAGQPVITLMAVNDFGRGVDAPNDWCYISSGANTLYHNFSFFPTGTTTFASDLYQIIDQGNPVARYKRDESAFKTGGSMPRPYAYRYNTALGSETTNGSILEIRGLNFGAVQGNVRLAVGTPGETIVQASDFIDWQDTFILIHVAGNLNINLSGKVKVSTGAATPLEFTSVDDLICSAYISGVVPATNVDPGGTVGISGFDFSPPTKTDVIGPDIYLFWVINATYTNPFTGLPETGLAQVVHPYAPDSVTPNLITFDMSRLDNVEVEVYNLNQTASAVVSATQAANATYFCIVWTGAVTPFSRPGAIVATSGIMSQAVEVNVGAGGGGPMTASLSANPMAASVLGGPNIVFTYSVIGGTAPYSFDLNLGDGSPHHMDTMDNTFSYKYTSASGPGGFAASLTVTDSTTATANAGPVNITVTP